ncbi:MAG: stalk domain-containing protein [Chthonomonadales bacterium]
MMNLSKTKTSIAMSFLALMPTASFANGELHRVTLPVGTVIPFKLTQAISSANSVVGDRVAAVLSPGRDDAGLPEGTKVFGVVREVQASRNGKPGVLDIDIQTLVTPDGRRTHLAASLYTLDKKALKRTDGRMVATADKGKDRLKWVGIGAGAGLIIATVTKGNTIVDTVLGAGAGYLFNEFSKKKAGDVKLKQGAEFGVRLDQSTTVALNDQSYNRIRSGFYDDSSTGDTYQAPGVDRSTRLADTVKPAITEPDDSSRPNPDRNRDGGNSSGIGIVLNNKEIRLDKSQQPYMRGEVAMVPIAAIATALRTDYTYNSSSKYLSVRDGKTKTTLGSRIAFVDGERRVMPIPAELSNGTVYVPSVFLDWAFNVRVSYDQPSRTIIISTDN